MPYPAPTTGVGVACQITLGAKTFTLSLSGANTHQMVPTLKDAAGTLKTPVASFIYTSTSPSVATVSASGLVTGVKKGGAVIEVCYPTYDNSHGTHTNGTHMEKIYAEVNIKVVI